MMENKINELICNIEYHNNKYYNEDTPEITDYEYDKLINELIELESKYPEYKRKDSPTLRVGGKALDKFEPVNHSRKMLSLSNAFSGDDLRAFDKRIKNTIKDNVNYVVEFKIDGLTVGLNYIKNFFTLGATRGDGNTGENVSKNLKTIKNIPLRIMESRNLIVRGEVYISKSDFLNINTAQENLGLPLYANSRNLSAGSLRQLDSKVTAKRPLDIFIFNLENYDDFPEIKTHSQSLKYLKSLGFKVSEDYKVCDNIEEVIKVIEYWEKHRQELKFDIDGMVIKVDRLSQREELGDTEKSPRWAIAYKFKAERKETILFDIKVEVGRTGNLTPRAVFKPVKLAGSTISSATLHNEDYIKEKDIKINDVVIIEKAGDVIPQVVEVAKSKRTGLEIEFKMPSHCPCCGERVVRLDGEAATKCINTKCNAQIERGIIYYVSKDAMNIDGLGKNTINILLENKLISNISDLYDLEIEELIKLEGIKEKSASKLIHSIEKSKDNDLWRLISGLGINEVGTKGSKILAAKFESLEKLMTADMSTLESIKDIGSITAKHIFNFFNDYKNQSIIKALIEKGVNTNKIQTTSEHTQIFKDMKIVLTGTLSSLKRAKAKELIEERGGKIISSVSKSTNFVIAGEEAGSKLDTALNLGITILSEDEFINILNTDSADEILNK